MLYAMGIGILCLAIWNWVLQMKLGAVEASCKYFSDKVYYLDNYVYCQKNRPFIKNCECGYPAEYFGEALMARISCTKCEESLQGCGWKLNIYERWNDGERGLINDGNYLEEEDNEVGN